MRLRDVSEQSSDGSSQATFVPRMTIEFGKAVRNGTLLVAAECNGCQVERSEIPYDCYGARSLALRSTSSAVRCLFFSFRIDCQSMARLERHQSKLDAAASDK